MPSETATIMFIDVAGFTKRTSTSTRGSLVLFQEFFDQVTIPIFNEFKGQVVKKIGDAFLVIFKSPTNAISCGMKLQNAFSHYNKSLPKTQRIKIRVALHTGEIVLHGKDIYGDAVNTSSRIEGITKEGDIVFSESVFLAMNKNEIPFLHLGNFKMKGLRSPVRLFRVKRKHERSFFSRLKKQRKN